MTADIKTRRQSIRFSALISGHREEVRRIAEDDRPEAEWSLAPHDCEYLPIVRDTGDGKFSIVDGMHRFSGMLLHFRLSRPEMAPCEEGGLLFPVIVVDAPREFLRSIDADSEIGNCAPLDAIYAADAEAQS